MPAQPAQAHRVGTHVRGQVRSRGAAPDALRSARARGGRPRGQGLRFRSDDRWVEESRTFRAWRPGSAEKCREASPPSRGFFFGTRLPPESEPTPSVPRQSRLHADCIWLGTDTPPAEKRRLAVGFRPVPTDFGFAPSRPRRSSPRCTRGLTTPSHPSGMARTMLRSYAHSLAVKRGIRGPGHPLRG
jgi:hypothetical protein